MRVVLALFLFIVSQPALGTTATSISSATEYPNEWSTMKKPHRLNDDEALSYQSGRPDLNRGPPAPKAGAIPGYATPRSGGKLLYPAFGAQRAQ